MVDAALAVVAVRAGTGVGGSRCGIIEASPHAPPGSFHSLTRFLAERDVRVLPGYEGPEKRPVLRISGIDNDETLLSWLKEDFPVWQREQGLYPPITVPSDLTCLPLDCPEHERTDASLLSAIRRHTGTAAGLCYTTGNVGLLISSFSNPQQETNLDGYKLASGTLYLAGGAILAAFGGKAGNPEDVWDIVQEAYPTLNDAAHADTRREAQGVLARVSDFCRRYPWELQALCSVGGGAAHLVSAVNRDEYGEAARTLGTIAAMMLPVVVPEKGGRALIDAGGVFAPAREGFARTMEMAAERMPALTPLLQAGERVADAIHTNPLRAAVPITALVNAGHLRKGIDKEDAGMIATGGAWLAGNALQVVSSKGTGASLDDVVTAAVEAMRQDPALRNAEPEALIEKAVALADTLSRRTDVMHGEYSLQNAMERRLKADNNAAAPSDDGSTVLDAYLPSEHALIRENPFVDPRVALGLAPHGNALPGR